MRLTLKEFVYTQNADWGFILPDGKALSGPKDLGYDKGEAYHELMAKKLLGVEDQQFHSSMEILNMALIKGYIRWRIDDYLGTFAFMKRSANGRIYNFLMDHPKVKEVSIQNGSGGYWNCSTEEAFEKLRSIL